MGHEELKKEVLSFFQNDGSFAGDLLDSGCDGIWYRELAGGETEWISSAFFRMLGYDPSEACRPDVRVRDFLHPDDVGILHKKADFQDPDGSFTGETTVRYFHRDGSVLLTSCRLRILSDRQGNPVRMLAVHKSIAGRNTGDRLMETRMELVQYAADHSMADLLQRVLDEVCSYVDSPIGFYHFVRPDQQTLSLQQWSTRTLEEFCRAEGGGLHYDVDRAGVWAECVHTKQPAVHNDYASVSNRKGLPEGHAEVVRELVVPVKRGDRVEALMGVGNKPDAYTDDDVNFVSYFADVTWEIIQRKKAQDEITLQKNIEEEISRLAGLLLTTTDLDEISSAVLDTAKLLTKSRFGFAGSVEPETGRFVLHALTGDILKQGSGMQDQSAVFAKWTGLWGWVLENRSSAMVNEPEMDSRSTGTPAGHVPIKAFLGVPAMIGDRVVGQIALANPETRFTELDRTVVQRMATLYAMAIQRREYEAAILAAETRKAEELDRLVTERTAQLAKSSELFRKVFTGQLDGIFILDGSEPPAILDCNPAAESLFGYKSGEVAGRTIESLHQGDTIPNALDHIRSSGSGYGGAFHLDDVEMQHRQGSSISVTAGITRLLDDAGQTFGFVLVVRDVREQKRYEQRLREALARMRASEERMKLALDSVSDAVWDMRVDTGETYFSSRWYTMLGYAPGEPPASYETWRSLVHPDDLLSAEDTFQRHLESGSPFEMEFRMKSSDGTWRWILARGKTVERDAKGNALRMLGTHMDITDRKYMEERLQQSQKMEAIGTLAGGIAHDFNNILAAIIGYTELVLHAPAKDADRNTERLQGVISAAERAQELIQQILTFSRAGEKRFKSMDISPVVKETIKFVRASLPSFVEIRTSLAEETLYISGNATQIHQVVMNLSTNAAQSMPKGGILSVTLSGVTLDNEFVRHFPDLSAGEFVKLTVADTGCGIPSDDLPKIFDPFFTTREKEQGTGMGLSLVHGIVKEHGGEILVHSTLGEGTRFEVYFPAAVKEAQQDRRHQEPFLSGSERVLMVDDEEVLSEIVRDMLEEMGYTVTSMTDGAGALELFTRQPERYDIILTDVTMPGMTGIRLASECRRIRSDIPIILWSGNKSHVSGEEMRTAGISQLLQKPVKQADLGAAIREALDRTP